VRVVQKRDIDNASTKGRGETRGVGAKITEMQTRERRGTPSTSPETTRAGLEADKKNRKKNIPGKKERSTRGKRARGKKKHRRAGKKNEAI